MERGRGIYHVSSGTDVSIADLYVEVAKAMQVDATIPPIVPRGPDDVATILLDPTETYQELGWSARTPLVTGIHAAVEWYEENGVTETFTHLTMKG
jgi:UDP-glucose 4-epimerase